MEILPWKRYSEESLAFGDQEMVIYALVPLSFSQHCKQRELLAATKYGRGERRLEKEGKIKFVWTEWIRADPRLMRSSDYPCEE